jgi:hypothetical protein
MQRGVFLGLLALAVALALLFGFLARSPRRPTDASGADAHARSTDTEDTVAARDRAGDAAEHMGIAASPGRSSADEAPAELARDRARRDEMRALIWHALGQAPPDAEAPPSQGTAYVLPVRPSWPEVSFDGAFGRIDPKYIGAAVRNDFFPLARDCYAKAQEKDPTIAGSVVLAFNIVGDEKIGGIVEAVDVLDKSTLRDPDMIECMRQSFLSTTFPPPEGGGTVTVEYPIVFSSGDGG